MLCWKFLPIDSNMLWWYCRWIQSKDKQLKSHRFEYRWLRLLTRWRYCSLALSYQHVITYPCHRLSAGIAIIDGLKQDCLIHWNREKMVWISIKSSMKFVPLGPINNIPALVQIMAWRRLGDKPLSEPRMVRLPTHICVTQPQWVYLLPTHCS